MKILFIGSLSKNKNDYLNYKILKKKNKVDTINIDNFFFSIRLVYFFYTIYISQYLKNGSIINSKKV